MGTTVRLLAEQPLEPVRAGIERLAARLTRFDPASELCALNADPRAEVPASPLLRRAVQAALLGARRTGGLADPTLLGAVEAAGYARTRAGVEPAPLEAALRAAPPRRPATPGGRWREIEVRERTIVRPPGLRIDLGGSAKGLAADWAASKLDGVFAVDCGGDVRVGGTHDVALRGTAHTLQVTDAAVATSGIDRRVWRRPDGSYAHHLLDPGSGEPAWTGLVSATAVAPTALEAEALAKAALLAGPRGARRFLAAAGGIVVRDDGHAEVIGGGEVAFGGGRPRVAA
jgi:thiamine biosynthesis lipoprotein